MENKNDILKADQDNGYIQYGEYTAMDIGQDKAGQNRIARGRLAGGGVLAGKKRQPVHSHFQRAVHVCSTPPWASDRFTHPLPAAANKGSEVSVK